MLLLFQMKMHWEDLILKIGSTDVNWYFLNHGSPSRNSFSSPLILGKQSKIDTPLGSDLESSREHNIINTSAPILHSTPHPCENFLFHLHQVV